MVQGMSHFRLWFLPSSFSQATELVQRYFLQTSEQSLFFSTFFSPHSTKMEKRGKGCVYHQRIWHYGNNLLSLLFLALFPQTWCCYQSLLCSCVPSSPIEMLGCKIYSHSAWIMMLSVLSFWLFVFNFLELFACTIATLFGLIFIFFFYKIHAVSHIVLKRISEGVGFHIYPALKQVLGG